MRYVWHDCNGGYERAVGESGETFTIGERVTLVDTGCCDGENCALLTEAEVISTCPGLGDPTCQVLSLKTISDVCHDDLPADVPGTLLA